ncbi:antigen 5 like allergen Cul n 1-like [Musca vetustissima]|uniref:antigen 5 like allergen Cul n 1-like n=1 Tax=Musca vetustissima TaxID=27455 RepID=UPI002AB799B7|nr:antigen 5 like allergen Cul n 1-like [Musca vetustissima]
MDTLGDFLLACKYKIKYDIDFNILITLQNYKYDETTGFCSEVLDWCDPNLCSSGEQHIACNNDGALHERCGYDAEIIDLEPYRDLIVHEHNKRRNFVALGLLPGYYPASRMATLQWDEELEYLADLNVRSCIVEHDECRNTYRFRNSGQNLVGISRFKNVYQNITEIILNDMWLWFREHKIINSDIITEFKVIGDLEKYGHFADLVLERNTHVGCSMIRYTRPEYPYLYIYNFACNYATVYAYDVPIYTVGRPGSKCRSGINSHYPGLCSPEEVYNPNY